MTDQEARYDRIAEGYARWWHPTHRPATLAMLEELEPEVAAGSTRILDIGCGTGALAAAAAARWPGVRVTGVDVSAGMLEVAGRELAALPAAVRSRIRLVHAPGERLPFADGSFDVAVSTFVLQLVPSAHRVMREARRVLAPGGTLAVATWMAGGSLPADDVYAAALEAAGLEPREPGGDGDDPRSTDEAVARLRRAGFGGVLARQVQVDHRYTPESYLAFIAAFDDEDLFASLEPGPRQALEEDLLARLRGVSPEALRLRLPVAIAKGRRTGRP